MNSNMSTERWYELMDNPDLVLTQDELDDGWHFCDSWDSLLIHTLDPEFKTCECGYMEHYHNL